MGWIAGFRNRRNYWGSQQYPNRIWENRNFNFGRHKRNYGRKSMWRRKDEVISIFVDNIDPKTSLETIRKQFAHFGDVNDVFISRKLRANNTKHFGFVKMKGPANAFRAIRQMRGRWIDQSRIFVKEASFKRKESENGRVKEQYNKRRHFPSKGEQLAGGKTISTPSQDKMEPIEEEKIVKVQVNPIILEELERSLIGECEESRSVEVLSQILTSQWISITKVRDLGPYKFIITFTDKDEMKHAVKMVDSLLLQYFSSISPWDIYQQGDTRRIWLEVMGIPPQVWSRETCERIASKFGILVCWDAKSETPESFVSCRMMIDTNIMSYISEVLYLNIDEQSIGKSIYVREGTNLTTCYLKPSALDTVLSSHQWDVSLNGNDHSCARSQECERDKGWENIEVVDETQVRSENSREADRSVTLLGHVNYDINEEEEIIARMQSTKANLGSPTNPESIDEDCPPGFQRIINPKFAKRSAKPLVVRNKNTDSKKNRATKKGKKQNLELEVAQIVGKSEEDNIETWSEDDFETDSVLEKRKSRNLGEFLGFGIGESLCIADLLN